ncbi:MAG: biopolymer transporter ExbD [Planctomycetota bacterium]|jgi:biopolymer transport protein ExbD
MSGNVGGEGCDVNLTPLLDLVLQLIMFFMITVNFVRVDQFDDAIHLPVSTNATPLDNTADEYIFLNLDGEGKLVGSLANFTLDTPGKLRTHLFREKQDLERIASKKGLPGPTKVVVVLRADQNVRYSKVWEVLESCKNATFIHWQLRVMTKAA